MSVSTPPISATSLEQLYAAIGQPAVVDPQVIIDFRKSDEGKQLTVWVKKKFTKCKSLRSKVEQQWNLNLAFYNGNQWVTMYGSNTTNAGRLGMPATAKNFKERQTINKIKPIVRTEMAKFMSQKPGASVVPATDEDEDILMAEAAEQVWESTYQRRLLDEEINDAVFWMCITGNGFIKTHWVSSLVDAASGQEGDIEYGSVDPYKMFFPDLKTKSIQAQPFIIHAYAKPLEWLMLNYADVIGDVKLKPSCAEAESISAESYAAMSTNNGEEAFDSCMMYELWVKPGQCPYLPKGGMVVMIDDFIVEYSGDGLPYDHGDYPFSHLTHIKTEGFYRTSIIDELINSQRDYNRLRSQIAESRKKMGKPQLTAPKGSISAAKITNEIGVVIEYKLGMAPPTPLPLQNMPQYIIEEVNLIKSDMEDISGQHEVSKGGTPPGVTAATAISFLQEADDSFILPSFKGVEAAYGSIARQTLQLCVQFWDVPRLIKVTGKDETFSTLLLSGSELSKATDIRIEPGSSLPQSKAARQAFIMDLMTNGFVDPNEGLDMLEIGGAKKLIDNIKNDKRQAQRENIKFKRLTDSTIMMYQQEFDMAMMQNGQAGATDPMTGLPLEPPLIIPVNSWDNHEVHIAEHDRFRRTQEFEVLSSGIKSAMQAHVEQHKTMQQQVAVQQMIAQIPSDGSAPGQVMPGAQPPVDPNAGSMGAGASPTPDFSNSGGGVPPADPNASPGLPSSSPPVSAN